MITVLTTPGSSFITMKILAAIIMRRGLISMFFIQNKLKKCFYLGLFLCLFIVIYYGYIYDDKDAPYRAILKCADPSNKSCPQLASKAFPKPSELINETVLKKKIKQGLPTWAMAQIAEDLSNFSTITQNDLDKAFKENDNFSNRLVRFQTKDGHTKVTGVSPSSIRAVINENGMNKIYYQVTPRDLSYIVLYDVIEYLAKNNYIPDTDFIVGLFDYLTIPSKKPTPIFAFSKDLAIPGEKDLILIPDWMNLRSVQKTSSQIKAANKHNPWKDKQTKLFWRGGPWDSTGFRKKTVEFSKLHPNLIDAKFTNNKDVPFTKLEDHLKYKYLIAIDGLRCTWERFVWHLHANSLIFKNESTQTQWFYKGIEPYVHYIPVSDEHSLLDKIEWAEKNPEKVQSIIANASYFAEQNLELEDMFHYYLVLIQEYTKRLRKSSL